MANKISMTAAAKGVADAMGSLDNQTSIVTQCVTFCRKHFGNEVPPKADVNDFANKVAEYRGWSESSAKVRKSEVRNLVRAHTRLDSVCKRLVKELDSFTWHNAIKAARLIHKNPSASDAAICKMYFEEKKANHKTQSQKVIDAAKTIANMTGRLGADAKAIQTAVEKALASAGIAA